MEELINSLTSLELLAIIGVNFLFIIILFILQWKTRTQYKKLKSKYHSFMNGLSDRNMEELLEDCLQRMQVTADKNREIENHLNQVERDLLQCIQKVGVVRFNAFENVGSDLSFSIALLDQHDHGIVISSIYSRDTSSTYAKAIAAGKSKHPLSAEEVQAIDLAKKNNRERIYTEK